MLRHIHEFCTLLLLLPLAFPLIGAAEDKPPPTPETIARWIEDLDDDTFSVREEATLQLQKAGEAATAAVIAAARGDRPEVTLRTLRILETWAFSQNSAIVESAKAALHDLANSKHRFAGRARNVLQSRQARIVAAFESRGATIYMADNQVISARFDGCEDLRDLHLLQELQDLDHLSFGTPKFDDDGLAKLKGLPRLRDLNLFESFIGDAGLEHLKTLPALRRVPMGLTQVTDKGLVHLKDLTELDYIGLRGNQITDAGLVHLKNLTNLTGLHLGETKVTDAGLVHLRQMTKLQMLRLNDTAVTDAGLEHLLGLTALQDLDLSNTKVTEEGITRLKKALPIVQLRSGEP